MRRSARFLIGGALVLGLVLAGCSSSEDADNTAGSAEGTDAPITASGGFCAVAGELQQKYLSALKEVTKDLQDNKTESADQLQKQLVTDMKLLQEKLPDDAPAEVKTAFSNVVTNLEKADPSQPPNQDDDSTVSSYMQKECPELNVTPSPAASPAQ